MDNLDYDLNHKVTVDDLKEIKKNSNRMHGPSTFRAIQSNS
jgi:hypothetical protein